MGGGAFLEAADLPADLAEEREFQVVGALRCCPEPALGRRDLLLQLLHVLQEDGPQLSPSGDCFS